MKIKGNTFMVTGGSSGLGEACVQLLAAGGANVIIADIQDEMGHSLAAGLNGKAIFVHTDVTHSDDVQQAIGTAAEKFGSLQGVISCAGIGSAALVVSKRGPHDLEAFTRTININLIGTFNVIRLAAEAIAQGEPNAAGERGVIINTASVAAFEGQIGQAAYSASKGGVVGMTLPIARELARHGIRVMTIAPGLFDTPMLASLPENIRQSLAQQIPFPSRLGQSHEYAQLVQQIIENEMLNGEVIRLDGAIRMAPR
jgi:NAD(P)-dependent dehydrogenase (short-subunit alcohol dehydrogenase family)